MLEQFRLEFYGIRSFRGACRFFATFQHMVKQENGTQEYPQLLCYV